MTRDTCRQCGGPMPSRAQRRGRESVYCSPACRQKAYRSRSVEATQDTVPTLIATIERQVHSLNPNAPRAFDSGTRNLATSVRKLRGIAREAVKNVTTKRVTERHRAENGDDTVAAALAGDESTFARLVEPHRRELQVHCYRMLGSFDESEDLVQETFLKAWRKRESFEGRSTFRAWLYRIATNACLDFLDHHRRRPQPYQVPPGAPPSVDVPPPTEISWLQPFPDRLLDEIASTEDEPDAAVVAKETIELVFLVAIQHLPARQRAVLIMRDVLGWPANETAGLLEMSVASVNSALQRARPTLRQHLPERRSEWAASADPTEAERALLRRYLDAATKSDTSAMAEMFSEDIRITMPPNPLWFAGRDTFVAGMAAVFDPDSPAYIGRWRDIVTWANRQPAVAHYVQRPGTSVYRAQVLDVLRIEDGLIVEITAFEPHLFPAFGLPLILTDR